MLGLIAAMFQESAMIRPVKIGARSRPSAPAGRPISARLDYLRSKIDGNLDGVIGQGNDLAFGGWAFAGAVPAVQVAIEARVGQQTLAIGVADTERPDLGALGMGDGHHGFHLVVPRDRLREAAGRAKQVEVVIAPIDSEREIARALIEP